MPLLFKAIIVDDEPPARRLLTGLLKEHDRVIDIIGEVDTGAKAIAIINTMHPEVIFMDIQLPDMLGFEVIKALNYRPFVIFTTAYDAYAIKAFDELSIDYLLKPIREERLARALDKLKHFTSGSAMPSVMNALETLVNGLKSQKEVKTLSVKKGSKFTLIQLADVLYFEAYDKYSFIHMLDGQKLFCDYMLSVLEEKLPGEFIRVQKSFILNREKITEIHKYSKNRFTIVLNDKPMTRIVTGPSFFAEVKEAFGV
jgi:two-component system LytT family response regulator